MLSKDSFRTFIVLWMTGLVLCFCILAVSLFWSTTRLKDMGLRVFVDSQSLEASRRLEASILAQRREELLWKVTGDAQHLMQRNTELAESEKVIEELMDYTTSPEERRIVDEIIQKFAAFKKASQQEGLPLEKLSPLVDALLKTVEHFGDTNRTQMLDTINASKRLNTEVDLWTAALIVFVGFIVILGTVVLINKIVQPTFALIRSAQEFGKGNFEKRVRIFRKDELGVLCETFNDMAVNIVELQRSRMNFIAAVAHDLKNSLMLIGGAARRIKKKNIESPECSQWLERIIEQVAYLEHLIFDLMDSIQIETGQMRLNKASMDFSNLVQSLCRLHNETVTTHRIVFENEQTCMVNGDEVRLQRVVTNLLSNAIKYSPPHSTVRLKIAPRENQAVFTIQDEGIGITKEDLDELFQPFSRLGRSGEMAAGTGLGLFSAKMIVECHGGRISIDSGGRQGTTVEITLPLAGEGV